ncbi:hypothetical protein A9239_03190 [Methanosarcina sp. A14]|nr:hypothetical protein A9239_03190 [Methanosarcina sp. A14]
MFYILLSSNLLAGKITAKGVEIYFLKTVWKTKLDKKSKYSTQAEIYIYSFQKIKNYNYIQSFSKNIFTKIQERNW